MTITHETITSTTEYQNTKDPIKKKFLTAKHIRDKVSHGVTVSLNRGFEYWNGNYHASDAVRSIVKEIYQREKNKETSL